MENKSSLILKAFNLKLWQPVAVTLHRNTKKHNSDYQYESLQWSVWQTISDFLVSIKKHSHKVYYTWLSHQSSVETSIMMYIKQLKVSTPSFRSRGTVMADIRPVWSDEEQTDITYSSRAFPHYFPLFQVWLELLLITSSHCILFTCSGLMIAPAVNICMCTAFGWKPG